MNTPKRPAKTKARHKNRPKGQLPKGREGQMVIKYRWYCNAIPGRIPDNLWAALEESARNHATEMHQQGFREGELCDYVNLKIPEVKTPEDGFHCRGWFTIEDN